MQPSNQRAYGPLLVLLKIRYAHATSQSESLWPIAGATIDEIRSCNQPIRELIAHCWWYCSRDKLMQPANQRADCPIVGATENESADPDQQHDFS